MSHLRGGETKKNHQGSPEAKFGVHVQDFKAGRSEVFEFWHYLDNVFNGLTDRGLQLLQVEDHGRRRKIPPGQELDRYRYDPAYLGCVNNLLARKEKA